jgi:hypothetical protein
VIVAGALLSGASALGIAASAGCGGVLASKGEYAAYRATRLAADERARILAEGRYMQQYPDGFWAKRIQAHRVEVEPAVWEASKGTREGLEYYLAAFPDGPHAAQARPRLAALMSVHGRREDEAERRRALEEQRRRAEEEARRTWMTRSMGYWTRTLVELSGWGSPIAEVAQNNPAFSRAFGENPRPRCTPDECVKFYRNAYAIPVPGATRIDRTIELTLRLKMPSQNVERIELLLPGKGFSRWFEMENRTIVTDEDPTQRQAAIDWALERLAPVLAEAGEPQPVDGVALEVFAPLPFTSTGETTGTSTPGSGGATPTPAAGGGGEGAGQGGSRSGGGATGGGATGGGGGGGGSAATGGGAGSAAGGELDALLSQAAGVRAPAPEEPAPEAPAVDMSAPATDEPAVPPRAVRIYRRGDVRLVVFAASDEDYGLAYDGLFVERVRPQAAGPAGGGGRPGGRPAPQRPAPRPTPRPGAAPR